MEYINHFGAIRVRLKGQGNILGTLYSYDQIQSDVLNSVPMSTATDDPVTLLADFTSYVAKLELSTQNIDDVMNISQILIYMKPVASSFPM